MKKAHGGDSLKNQRLLYPGKTFRSKFGKWGNVYLFIILTVFVNNGAFAVRRSIKTASALFHIAKFAQPSEAAESIENFQDAFDPDNGPSETAEPALI